MLRCSNPECESRMGQVDPETPMFTLNVTVDSNAQLTECLRRVEPDHFLCCYCHAEAEELEEYNQTNDAMDKLSESMNPVGGE